ncbi:ATP-binding cassette domain-containing protein [Pseudomonas agarici]|uniref:ABC transporter ATP-binding protein n=1 Tax=Pseudomonas agarici TaxID=46677 RepID=UPI000369771F|nr:ATP-binding cassette domain-containing protein [Pseudomonas agarici]NWC10624.1 ATP-binding cassette domain-containing protein [Pseudomonas agarici]SEL11470.1 lipopolysaccharide transport system ATP-binding protein [Pseudomonas agarici]
MDIVIRICNATVEIPLRGVKEEVVGTDPRIIRRRNGSIVLRALENISLEVRRGERIGIVGGNGNGKTTLLKLIGGMLPTVSGTVEVYGSIRTLLTIGAGTVPALTGRQNVKMRYALLGIKSITESEYVSDVEAFSDIGAFFDMPMGTYSPGMYSRLQFAMSTVEPADILLLDEWIGVADQAFQDKANDRLEHYIQRNEGFLFASHNEELLKRMTSRTIRLINGRLEDNQDPELYLRKIKHRRNV